MVGVVILGLLAALAVPTYKVLSRRARQAEAKSILGAMYTAESIFKSENHSYTGCLDGAGFTVLDDSIRYYNIGFADETAEQNNCGPSGNQSCYASSFRPLIRCGLGGTSTSNSKGDKHDSHCVWYPYPFVSSKSAGHNICGFDEVTRDRFTIHACGNIADPSPDPNDPNPPYFDYWQIDNRKRIMNVQPGL